MPDFAAEAGQLQLNAFEPIIAHSLFESLKHLRRGVQTLTERCVQGITANRQRLRSMVNSIGLVTALNPLIGYANATAVAQEALLTGKSVYDLVLAKGLLSKEMLDDVLQPETLTKPRQVTAKMRPCGVHSGSKNHGTLGSVAASVQPVRHK